jgi:hypothetical protein
VILTINIVHLSDQVLCMYPIITSVILLSRKNFRAEFQMLCFHIKLNMYSCWFIFVSTPKNNDKYGFRLAVMYLCITKIIVPFVYDIIRDVSSLWVINVPSYVYSS